MGRVVKFRRLRKRKEGKARRSMRQGKEGIEVEWKLE